MNPAPLDGNAAAGDLADVFAFDVTGGDHLRQLPPRPPDGDAAGVRAGTRIVLRCFSCDAVQARSCAPRNERGSTYAASTCSRSLLASRP